MRTLVTMLSAAVLGFSSLVYGGGVQARQDSIAVSGDHYRGSVNNAAPLQLAHNDGHKSSARYNYSSGRHVKDVRHHDKKRRDDFRKNHHSHGDKYGRYEHRDQRPHAKGWHHNDRDRYQHTRRGYPDDRDQHRQTRRWERDSSDRRSHADRGDIDSRRHARSVDNEARGSWRERAGSDAGQQDRQRSQSGSDRRQTEGQRQRPAEGGGEASDTRQRPDDGMDTSRTGRDADRRFRT